MPEVTEGVVPGGWPYVVAVYSLTAVVLIGYALSLVYRLRRCNERDET